ncbi:MAG: hypothetical protein Q7T57_08775 [Dehalococcoidales bacterium]|nr:hypothetical protein [Dehalococcoidales bacterium]
MADSFCATSGGMLSASTAAFSIYFLLILRIFQTFVVVVDGTHDQSVTATFIGHPVFLVYISLVNIFQTLNTVTTQSGMTEVSVE